MSLDHYVTLGRSGLRVSQFCLGAMTFGEDRGWGSTVPTIMHAGSTVDGEPSEGWPMAPRGDDERH